MTAMSLVNRVLAALVALALLLGGVLAAVEIGLAAIGRSPWLVPHDQWSTWLQEHAWNTAIVRVILAGLVVLGLTLLWVALRRGKPNTLALPARASGVQFTASRRGVEATLAAAARRTDGITSANATAGRRTVRVKAGTSMRSPGDLQQRVTNAVTERLDELGLTQTLRARVALSRKEAR